MSALDKLNAKANIKKETKEKTPSTKPATKAAQRKKEVSLKDQIVSAEKKQTEIKQKKELKNEKEKTVAKKATGSGKHPGGRTNTRGKMGEDFKMINIAVPIEVYDMLKEASHGNMTYYVNSLLRESVGL